MPIMLSFDSLEVKASKRQNLCRSRTFEGSFPSKAQHEHDVDDDNDNNTSSTLKSKPHDKPKKNVTFANESTNVCHIFEKLDLENSKLSDYWVLPDELREIKKQGFLACKEANRTGLAGLLTEIYGTANDRATQERLDYWCRMASACRGLERFANEELNKRRNVYRKRAIISVLEAQQQLKNEKGIDTANVLRRLSEAYTEQARVYAEKLGRADHQALQILTHPPQPPPASPSRAGPSRRKSGDGSSGQNGRKSRMERMKERSVATAAASAAAAESAASAGQQGEQIFRRNNTTMTAVVLQQ